MRGDEITLGARPYNIVILTLDSHAAGPVGADRAAAGADFPGLNITVHAAAEWGETPEALAEAKARIAEADMVAGEPAVPRGTHPRRSCRPARVRDRVDAMIGVIADAQIVQA
jgi:magnesium chelatase subunit H